MPFIRTLTGALAALLTVAAVAAPLSKTQPIDFYVDVPSRSLQAMATRSDGRLLAGPAVAPVNLKLASPLMWTLVNDGDNLLIGTGPDGQVLSVNPNAKGEPSSTVLLDLPETHIFAVARLADGRVLVGSSPQGTLVLAQEGKVLARAALPVDSIFDLVVLPGDKAKPVVLVATGNPGRIYRVEIATFVTSGDQADKLTSNEALAARGIKLFGEIRDRNVRRLLRLTDGRVVAGSAPKGNVYEFSAAGGAPRILSEQRNAEICDLLPWDGGFFAAVTFGSGSGESRVNRSKPAKAEDNAAAPAAGASETPPPIFVDEPARPERFAGRSQLLWFPDGGFPETVAARGNVAFYRLARHGDLVLIAGGEQGELLGYEPANQRSLTFPGVTSVQLNGLVPIARKPGAFLAIANNPASLYRVDFTTAGGRSAETRRIDLGTPAQLGLLRLGNGTQIAAGALTVELRTSFGSDETEGWTAWQQAVAEDGGWRVPGLRGRHVQARLSTSAAGFEIDKAELHFLRQNRRPQLQEFRLLSPNYGLVPAPEPSMQVVTTLGQVLQPASRDDDKRRNPLLTSQIVPLPGAQVAYWTVTDPDDDNLVSTFSLRLRGAETWTDLAVASRENYIQFDISHFPEGVYQTRLVVKETAPRVEKDCLTTVFEADDLLIDRTPPVLGDVKVTHESGRLRIQVPARDEFSRIAGVEFALNNGARETVEQPDDGVLDGLTESFTLDLPADRAAGATSIEIIAYDNIGNSAARRVACP
jgi:hypothetical protein